MNTFQFARSKRSIIPSSDDIKIIFTQIPELGDNKLVFTLYDILGKCQPGVIYDQNTDTEVNCMASIIYNIAMLNAYLSEDSQETIDSLMLNKIFDPYVESVMLSIAMQIKRVDKNRLNNIVRTILGCTHNLKAYNLSVKVIAKKISFIDIRV